MTYVKKIFNIIKHLLNKKKTCYDLFRIGGSRIMKLEVFDVANFFRSKEQMTHKKLQKLVYYAYAWYIALYNEDKGNIQNKLCENTVFEAWVHGPVCRKLYDSFSNNYGMVDKYKAKINPLINGELKKFLEKIYKIFGKYTGDELESMTHQEFPWKNARNNLSPSEPSNEPILESDMFVYYNSL